jgi:DNA-binding SARP family transcriptional activator
MGSAHDVQVEFGMLGSLVASSMGSPITLASAKTRVVLASLLLRPGRPVSTADLVERLWDGEPTKGARNTAQSYVMRLRASLGDASGVIRTHPGGYLIDVPEAAVDLWRFRQHLALAKQAQEAGELQAEAHELQAGLALWRGAPLTDVPSDFLHRREVPTLVEEHLQTLERRIDVELELGQHARLIAELHKLTTEHPLREHFWGQLMLALVRSERQADALAVYREVSALLRQELGVDPGEPLQRLHHQILNGDATVTRTAAVAPRPSSAERWAAPMQLPPDISDFVGRDAQVAKIDELTGRIRTRGRAVPIAVLSGPPGVGKTALAIHVAHRLSSRFPDGQLYIDLRGYSTSPPVPASDGLARLLRALGTPSELIPHDLDDQSALFRSTLASRRVLVVLDNAISPDQIRPLLPGTSTCAVLVTSRDNLHSLVALNGAHRIPVDLVTTEDARELLSVLLGTERVASEPQAVEEFAALCGHLPLAIRIVAANLLAIPDQGIAEYVGQMRSADRLAAMAIEGDEQAAVNWAFDRSYGVLKPDLARFFRFLSLIPGPDFDIYAAANVAGVGVAAARRMLDQLSTANLAYSRAAGRYEFHDLIKEFARRKSQDEDDPSERRRSVWRLFEFYVDTARLAEAMAKHDARASTPPKQERPQGRPDLSAPADARAWLTAEMANLVALVCDRAHHGFTLPSWRLAKEMLGHFERQRLDPAWRATVSAALTSADECGERAASAEMEVGLGRLDFLQARYDDARAHYLRAVNLFRRSSDLAGEARSLTGMGAVAFDQGAYGEAIDRFGQAASLFRRAPNASERVATLYNLGITLAMSGQTAEAIKQFAVAKRLAKTLDLRLMEARITASTAMTDLWQGRVRVATANFSSALEVMRALAYPQYVSEVLRSLAEASLESGDLDQAYGFGEQALEMSAQVNSRWLTVGARTILGRIALGRGDTDKAIDHFTVARNEAASAVRHWYSSATRGLAECYRWTGHLDIAAQLASAALQDPRPRERGRAHAELAKILLGRGEHLQALNEAERAVGVGRAHGYQLDQARALHTAAELRSLIGDDEAAQDLRAQAEAVVAATELSDQPQQTESPDD